MPAILEDRVHGLLVPPDDDRAMADAALRLLNDEALAGQLTRQAWADDRCVYPGPRSARCGCPPIGVWPPPCPHPAAQLERA